MKSLILRDNQNPVIPGIEIFKSDKLGIAAELYVYGKGTMLTFAEIEQVIKCLSSYLRWTSIILWTKQRKEVNNAVA